MSETAEKAFEIGRTSGIGWLQKEIKYLGLMDLKMKKYLAKETYTQIIASARDHLKEIARTDSKYEEIIDLLDEKILKEKDKLEKDINKILEI